VGNLRERDHLEDPGVDGRKKLKLVFRKWDGNTDLHDLFQDTDRWRAFVIKTMNL